LLPAATASSIGGAVTHPAVEVAEAVAVEAGMTGALLLVIVAFVSNARLARRTPHAARRWRSCPCWAR
jgi:hypothetical protein